MICNFSTRYPKGSRKMGSESEDRSSVSGESVFSSEEPGSSRGLMSSNTSCSNSATSTRESSFDEFRSDSCSSDYCDDELESDKLLLEHQKIVNVLEASQQALRLRHDDKHDLLFQALQCRWLLLRDQLLQIGKKEEDIYGIFYHCYTVY